MKKCVNGNCSIKAECALYHQAKNMEEARGADGKFDRHSCRKGKCDHFVARSSHTQEKRNCIIHVTTKKAFDNQYFRPDKKTKRKQPLCDERATKNSAMDHSIGFYQDPYMPDHESAF